MKKLLKITLVFSLFVFGLVFTGNAEEECYTAEVYCSNGNAGYGLVCGSNADEMTDEVSDLSDAICNPD